MERRRTIDQVLSIVVHNGDGGDPEPDGECPGLVGCADYDPCPLKGHRHPTGLGVSGALSREIATRVRHRLGIRK